MTWRCRNCVWARTGQLLGKRCYCATRECYKHIAFTFQYRVLVCLIVRMSCSKKQKQSHAQMKLQKRSKPRRKNQLLLQKTRLANISTRNGRSECSNSIMIQLIKQLRFSVARGKAITSNYFLCFSDFSSSSSSAIFNFVFPTWRQNGTVMNTKQQN